MSEAIGTLVELPLESIEPNPYNLRTRLGMGDLQGLMRSIASEGLIHPILVRPHPDPERYGHYQIVCGERRYTAFRHLAAEDPERFGTIPARVQRLDDEEMLAVILQENALRADWTPYERAAFYRAIYESGRFRSIRAMAASMGIGLATLHRYLRIFDLDGRIVALFKEGRLGLAQMEVILEAPPAVRWELARLLADRGGTKAEARRLAERLAHPEREDWRDRLTAALPEGVHARPQGERGLRLELAAEDPATLAERLRALLERLEVGEPG